MDGAGAALSLWTLGTADRASVQDRAPQQKLRQVKFNLSRIGATETNVKEGLGQTLGGEQSQKISENNPPYFLILHRVTEEGSTVKLENLSEISLF